MTHRPNMLYIDNAGYGHLTTIDEMGWRRTSEHHAWAPLGNFPEQKQRMTYMTPRYDFTLLLAAIALIIAISGVWLAILCRADAPASFNDRFGYWTMTDKGTMPRN